jgi:hypothetical protein
MLPSNPCAFGNCTDDGTIPNAFNCTCDIGYNGTLCNEDFDDCVSNPCDTEGTNSCLDTGTSLFECSCNTGYSGVRCHIPPGCASSPCPSNITCFDDDGPDFTCDCARGYTGVLCDEDLDDCLASPCHEDGSDGCVDLGFLNYECFCVTGWSGKDCELSETRTVTIRTILLPEVDVATFATDLELDLEVLYQGTNITIVVTEFENQDITMFEVTFLDEELQLPEQAEIEDVITEGDYNGVTIFSRNSGDDDDADDNAGGQKDLFLYVLLVLSVSVVFVVAFMLYKRRKQKVKFVTPV